MALVEELYRITATFPKGELYGLTNQIRRSAVSVPCNIAEGAARSGSRELRQFLAIAQASLSELDTLLDIAKRVGYLRDIQATTARVDQVAGLISKLRSSIQTA
jgi:four helix bundle protein